MISRLKSCCLFCNLPVLRWKLSGLLVLLSFAIATTSVAAPNPNRPEPGLDGRQTLSGGESGQNSRRPPPPKIAVEACGGKQEGDSCSFTSSEGLQNGECRSGMENIFACRPHRGDKPSEPFQGAGRERQPGLQTGNQQESERPSTIPESKIKPVPVTDSKPTIPTHSPEQKPPATQISPVPSAQPDTPDAQSNIGHAIIDTFIGNAGAFFGVVLFSVLLTWYVFFRYYTLPLRRLRKVTQQLAGGDLSARVGEGLLHRKNEVVELGRDVDRMAERIESLVGAHQRLIRDVSHELRSPLARLNVALELARQSAGPTHSAPFDRIERESERLNELIGQLLMLTKLESESGMPQRTDIDITALIEEITHDVNYEASNRNRRVEIVENDSMKLVGNREMLRQAFENVIRNAVRYTADDTTVEIICRRRVGKGRPLGHIEIRDHGPGVPESEIFNIFRPFYRVADARERQSGGTGVGLAISDRAIRRHGGSIRAINATGEGLIVEIELPLGE